jgi:hypothetical protein
MIEPIAPEELEIARLAPRMREVDEAPATPAARGRIARVSVQLRRARVGVDDDAMHFRLKMALLRGLRRRFRYSLLEVDDAAPGNDGDKPFVVVVEPAEPEAVEQARGVVARVLRGRRWREGAAA